MINNSLNEVKANIISIGRLLWDKDLVGGLNGNISVKVSDSQILITGRRTCLGFLTEEGIVRLGFDGAVVGGGEASSEKFLHLEIYKAFPEARAIIHTHTTYTNAFFLHNDVFRPQTLEAEYVLGEVFAVDQPTINVTDALSVVERLRVNKIVVLRRHGVVVTGDDLFECFVKVQGLEEQIKVGVVSGLVKNAESSVRP
ncbi:MAG: class II aldolase/adducin family protein [Candidatus Omnitrophica bacterium]|nr:class II aldolase/adducin family protein [Candidatus Omnitrophota bacterium]